MVLPTEVGDAAQDGDRDRVMAWLNAGGSINDVDGDGYTLLKCCASGDLDFQVIGDGQVALARDLIGLGADVNIAAVHRVQPAEAKNGSHTALHEVARKDRDGQAVLEMLSLLLGAGANVNAKDLRNGNTPLYHAIIYQQPELCLAMITKLLRAGASLDACHGDETAEDVLRWSESHRPNLTGDEHWKRLRALVAGVRKYGTYKKYMRTPHRDVLAVRGLAQRGKLRTDDPVLHFLARLGDNGVVWHVLSFWRATN
jgi:hypothetical protein